MHRLYSEFGKTFTVMPEGSQSELEVRHLTPTSLSSELKSVYAYVEIPAAMHKLQADIDVVRAKMSHF